MKSFSSQGLYAFFGGAIFGGKQRIVIRNCTFSGNTASYGPALFNDTPDAVAVFNTLFVARQSMRCGRI